MLPQPSVQQPDPESAVETGGLALHAALRFGVFLVVWLAVHGGGRLDLIVGVLAAGGASLLSLGLLPPAKAPLSLGRLLRLAFAFPVQSFHAGFDVARRALSPSMGLSAGIVPCPTGLPEGIGRQAFHAYMSLQPGTLPVAMSDDRTLLVHALDTSVPVLESFSEHEAAFRRLRERPRNA